LLYIRINIDKGITVNNWKWGGKFTQRGLRTNVSPLVKNKKGLYLSAHIRGAAVDFDVDGMTAVEVRKWLVKHVAELPHKIRLENEMNGKQINWCHLDVDNEPKNEKVYLFNI
jgi:hypothetical protein